MNTPHYEWTYTELAPNMNGRSLVEITVIATTFSESLDAAEALAAATYDTHAHGDPRLSLVNIKQIEPRRTPGKVHTFK